MSLNPEVQQFAKENRRRLLGLKKRIDGIIEEIELYEEDQKRDAN